jgi:ABC-2 type transport system permease protein
MGAIYVMWLRQLKRYGRSPARIVASLGQPLLFFVALGFGLGRVFQAAGAGNYLNFLAPGIMAMSIIFTSVFSGMDLIWDRQFGFLKETLVAPVSRVAIMFGRVLGGSTTSTLQGVLVLLLSIALGFRPEHWWGVIAAIGAGLSLAFLFAAFGLLLGTLMRDMQGYPLVMNFVVMPMFFLSGAVFPLDRVASAMRLLAMIDPLTYGVDALRRLLTGSAQFSLLTDLSVTIALSLVLLLLAARSFSRMQV